MDRHGGIHGRNLTDLSPKAVQGQIQGVPGHGTGICLHSFSGHIPCIRPFSEAESGPVFLCRIRKQIRRFGGAPQQQREHAGGHGIQSPGMSYFPFLCQPAHHRDCVEGSKVLWFIQYDDAVHGILSISEAVWEKLEKQRVRALPPPRSGKSPSPPSRFPPGWCPRFPYRR